MFFFYILLFKKKLDALFRSKMSLKTAALGVKAILFVRKHLHFGVHIIILSEIVTRFSIEKRGLGLVRVLSEFWVTP